MNDVGYFFGGPEDGAKRVLTPEELDTKQVQSIDASGALFLYVATPLVTGGYRLTPADQERP